jgi:hypothetical protein
MNARATIEELLDASISMRCVLYQRKVGGQFFPELFISDGVASKKTFVPQKYNIMMTLSVEASSCDRHWGPTWASASC